MKEVWKDIPGFEGQYQASTLGNIRSVNRTQVFIQNNKKIKRNVKGRILAFAKPHGTCQYFQVALGHGTKTFNVHRLIAITFLENPLNKKFVNHKNFNKLDNTVKNLEWVSLSENAKHYTSSANSKKDGAYKNAKLTVKQVLEIRILCENKIDQKIIGEEYGVSKSMISLIHNRERWGHI